MRELKMLIVPSTTATVLWARDWKYATKLRAVLPSEPWHARALPLLLEALGSFVPLRAALVVPTQGHSSATRLYPAWFADLGGDNYDLQIIGGSPRERREWWAR